MESIVCDRCFKGGHTNTNCVEVYDIEGNAIQNLSPIPEIQNLESPKPTNYQEDDIFPYDDDDDVYSQNSNDRWSQKEWTEKDDCDDFDEQERLFNLQVQQEELEFQHEDETDLYNNEHYEDYDNFSKASTM
jgi:hypothetical protein